MINRKRKIKQLRRPRSTESVERTVDSQTAIALFNKMVADARRELLNSNNVTVRGTKRANAFDDVIFISDTMSLKLNTGGRAQW